MVLTFVFRDKGVEFRVWVSKRVCRILPESLSGFRLRFP